MSSDTPRQRKKHEVEEEPKAGSSKCEVPRRSPMASSACTDTFNSFVNSFNAALDSVVGEVCCGRKLSTLTIEGIADYIKRQKPQNVIVMSGAGISTSAGIPDFRSPNSGLYANLQKYNLPEPEAIFSIDFFARNPEPFFTLAKELFPKDMKPTPTHYFVRLLEQKGILARWYTQNIDSLEYLTGIPEEKVVTAHGDHHTSTCRKCRAKYGLEWITEKLQDKNCLVPKCEKPDCAGVVKPDIVFFGENLPMRFFNCAMQDFPKCDLLLILGTSLVVQPFASMVHEVDEQCPRLLINMEKAGQNRRKHRSCGEPELCYGRDNNTRDVFWKGTCDDGVQRLAELLKWDAELDLLIEQGPHKLQQKKI